MRSVCRGAVIVCSLTVLVACGGGGEGGRGSLPTENDPNRPAHLVASTAVSQSADVGGPAPVVPAVRVTNSQGTVLPGIPVVFTVIAGAGSLSGAFQSTDANGVATLGSWTMGPTPGGNTVSAAVAGLPAVVFTAVASLPAGCTTVTPLPLFGTKNGTLGTQSCPQNGARVDSYSTTLALQTDVVFTAASVAFNPAIRVLNSQGREVAANDDAAPNTTNALARAVLPAGNYKVEVRSAAPAAGPYAVGTVEGPGRVTDCSPVFVTKGTRLDQIIGSADCVISGQRSERYIIHLDVGQSVRVDAFDCCSIGGLGLTLLAPDGSLVLRKEGDAGGAVFLYTATASGYYVIVVSSRGVVTELRYDLVIS